MSWFERLSAGLSRTREQFGEQMNVLFDRGPDVDASFYDDLEETLILSDFGPRAAAQVTERLRDTARRKALPDASATLSLLEQTIVDQFASCENNPFKQERSVVLFVGINGSGKTTTVGKLAKLLTDEGQTVVLGSADTFRAAAIEQLDVWAHRAGVEVIKRERGSDPASVCFEVVERAEAQGASMVLIDTSGRLHTSADLMRELEKIVNVTRKRATCPVYTVLVMDATTGQNGLAQAREFDKALTLDGIIMTKLDGTAKGGIAVAVSHELGLPLYYLGVGEGIEDLRPFDPHEFAQALIGSRGREE